jgi:hypothetical protein
MLEIHANKFMYCATYIVCGMTAKWLSVDALLQHKVGLSQEEVNTIWDYCRDQLIEHYLDSHHFEPTIYPYESLLMTLYWLRDYPPDRALAAEYDTSQPVIREHRQHVIDALSTSFVNLYLSIQNAPTQRTRLQTGDYCYGAVDSTFICIHEPEEKEDRQQYYHIKAGTSYALKFQLVVHMNGFMWNVTNVVIGSTHDATLFRASSIPAHLSANYRLLADKGYQGVENLITPMKKPRDRELNDAELKVNKDINSHRAIVENVIHVLKGWSIIGSVYRQNRTDLEQASTIVKIIAALYNLRFTRMRLRAT